MKPVASMPAITLSRAAIESGAPPVAEDLEPFAASVRQALDELGAALSVR